MKWNVEYVDENGDGFFTLEEASSADDAKGIVEKENPGSNVTLVTDFWDHRKNRHQYGES